MNSRLPVGKWVLWSSILFGTVAAAAMMLQVRGWSPIAIFAFVASFVLAVVFWQQVDSADVVSLLSGGVAGAAIGLLTPVLAWLLYAPFLVLTSAEPSEAFGWSLAYAFAYSIHFIWVSVPTGTVLGVMVSYLQNRKLDVT